MYDEVPGTILARMLVGVWLVPLLYASCGCASATASI